MPPSQTPDKYAFRETKCRLQRGQDSGRQSLLGPRACTHLFPLRWDPFCGEHWVGTLGWEPTRWEPSRLPQPPCTLPRVMPLLLSSTAVCQPLRLLPSISPLDSLPLWLQWLPQPQPRARPRKRRRPRPQQAFALPVLREAQVSLHPWGGCGPHCRLRGEALVALGLPHSARWAPQQDWHWARHYGLPSVVRVDLSRLDPLPAPATAPALVTPAASAHSGNPGSIPASVPVPKQALAFASFSPRRRLRLVVSHGSIDLDVNSDEL